MEDDWRIVNQERYLFKKKLIKRKFTANGNCDHAHCSFCWDKFGEQNEMLHSGYLTLNGNWWICEQCYMDFKDRFQWELVQIDLA